MILHVSSKTTDSKRHLGMQWGRFLWKPSGLVPTEQGWELLKFLNKWWVDMRLWSLTCLRYIERQGMNQSLSCPDPFYRQE